jgi:Flp pilus assembly protein TadB
MLDTLVLNTWLIAVLWAALYIFDYASTLWLARVYQTTLSKYIYYEGGVELNPNFEKEIGHGQAPSPKFLLLVALILLIILFSWLLGVYFVEFLAGALLLTWVFVDSRHLRNYAYVWFLRTKPESIKGRSEYSYWLTQKMLSSEAFTFSLIYLFLALLTWRLFFLAGVLTCLSFTLRHYRLADRKLPPAAQTRPKITVH